MSAIFLLSGLAIKMKKCNHENKKKLHVNIDMSKVGQALADMMVFSIDESLMVPTRTDKLIGTGVQIIQSALAFLVEAFTDPTISYPAVRDFIEASDYKNLKDDKFDGISNALIDDLMKDHTIN